MLKQIGPMLALVAGMALPATVMAQTATQSLQTPATQSAPAAQGNKPQYWGAIGFTSDGSYATAWKQPSKAEAEADVAKRCAKMGRGECEVIGFRGELCVGLATYIGSHSGRRYKLSFSGGGLTSPDAQQTALNRCNEDKRTRGRCQLRTVACGDGR
ncbi:MAG: DUF4189 domain-containing protein [Xanthobacteraceae bacterium]|nr:MAG: DUF4189 domain-containing protein [Xanthobacteraceae bacterium]